MKIITYNKLVRDQIPEIIEKSGNNNFSVSEGHQTDNKLFCDLIENKEKDGKDEREKEKGF